MNPDEAPLSQEVLVDALQLAMLAAFTHIRSALVAKSPEQLMTTACPVRWGLHASWSVEAYLRSVQEAVDNYQGLVELYEDACDNSVQLARVV